MTAASLVFILVSLALLATGFLIRNKGMTWLIAGYDARRVRDEPGLANWVGSGLMGIASVGVLCGALLSVFPRQGGILVIAFVAVAVGGMAVLVNGLRRYLK